MNSNIMITVLLIREIIHPLLEFEPRSLHGTEYEADDLPMGHHASLDNHKNVYILFCTIQK